MPAIGATLREARMRAHIDISEIESATKIRAKYLRALENEEWDLLPGPTYVKSFLRTYAEALGLDARLLLEEYKLRHERLSDIELQPIAPPGRDMGGRRRRGGGGGPAIPRAYVIWFVVLALLAGIYLLGNSSSNNGTSPTSVPTGASKPVATTPSTSKKKAAPRFARLQIVATAPVYVCLKAAGSRTLLNGVTLMPGASTQTYRSSRFDLTLGNSNARMRVNGRLLTVPAVTTGIGYRVTPRGRRSLAPGKRPVCA
ncbi:MAG: cytoskeleton protein RodZ [Solirubrobacteraceae bacterium]|nr:cytoskeleton protein RodZ [Solirubrobacteraceae bacterium]